MTKKSAISQKSQKEEQEMGEDAKHEDTRRSEVPIEHTAVGKTFETSSQADEEEKST